MLSQLAWRLAVAAVLLYWLPVSAVAGSPYNIRVIDQDSWTEFGEVNDTTTISEGTTGAICLWVEPGSGPDGPIGGFDFLLNIPNDAFAFVNAGRGTELHPAWEYFTWRTNQPGDTCVDCPPQSLRLTAIANLAGGGTPPDEAYALSGCIAEIALYATSDPAWQDTNLTIGFCTTDCGDNIATSQNGDTLYLPSSGTLLCPGHDPDACTTGAAGKNIPYANFHPGTVRIIPHANSHGDINLNGIQNEISDFVNFTYFLVFGWGTLTPPYDTIQFLNMEINCDGTPGTALDLNILSGIIGGDMQPDPVCPDPALPPDTTWTDPTPSSLDTMRVGIQTGHPGDTITVDIYLRNTDTIGAFDFRLVYDPLVLEPLTDTGGPYGLMFISAETELLRAPTSLDMRVGTPSQPGVLTYVGAELDHHSPPYFTPGAGATVRTWWRIQSGAPVGATPVAFEDDPDWPQMYNTVSDNRAVRWVRPALIDGEVVVVAPDCTCPNQLDLYKDGQLDPLDLNLVIEYMFFYSGPPLPNPGCPTDVADYDNDGWTSPLDLNGLIDYLFYGGPPPCDPCNPLQASCQ